MFKNAILYKIASIDQGLDVESCLNDAAFSPCAPSQEKVSGWVPPREANGSMIESVGGQWIMKLMTETKSVPADVINRKAAERCVQIEASTGRKPGKKETRDIKDDIRLELLPHAFAKQSATLVWIDIEAGVLLVDASSQAKADDVVTALISAVPGLALSLVNTQQSPVSCMAEWLLEQEPPAGFDIDRECELKAADESKSVVKYSKHSLDIGEIPDHIMAGKMPTKLAMTWSDRVSFVLTEGLQLKKLAFLDVVFESRIKASSEGVDGFDADFAIATGELRKLIPDLIDALGGELVAQESPALPDGITSVTIVRNPSNPDHHLGSHVDGPDPLYNQAADIVLKNQKASISLVQRHLRIGYNRAARLIEDMEKAGLVSPMGTNGERKIL